MYCPKCSAQNEPEQKYCPHCGLTLAPVRLALDGRAEEAIAKFQRGKKSIYGSAMTLGIWSGCALINTLLIPSPWNVYVAGVNVALGLLIAVPMAITGFVRFSRAEGVLDRKVDAGHALEDRSQYSELPLPKPSTTNPLFSRPPAPGSVTEHTTRNLK